MISRLMKLERASTLILRRIESTNPKPIEFCSHSKTVETFLSLFKKNILLIGKNNRFIIEEISAWDLEDMLNILQQYSKITNYERVCGDVFRVQIRTTLKPATTVVIALQPKGQAA